MKFYQKFYLVATTALVLILGIIYLKSSNSPVFGTVDVPFMTVTSGSATTATNTITRLISANTGRSYLAVVNDSATTTYLGLSATSTGTVVNTGLRLNAGDIYEFRDVNLYQGDIWLATTSVPQKILYIER